MESIGIVNAQGNTVLQSVPDRIRVKEGNYILDKFTGVSYSMPGPEVGLSRAERGIIVNPGDYVGERGEFRSLRWLVMNPTEWERVG